MDKINVAELLNGCPKGMELDCTMWDNVVLDHIDMTRDYPIYIRIKGGGYEQLTKYGQWNHGNNAKCVIFPKGETTWEGFVPPCKFKDGDILYVKAAFDWICIYKESEDTENVYKYVAVLRQSNATSITKDIQCLCYRGNVSEIRLATEEEKEKLFKAIKDNGYKWNAETKTLKKLIEPKFKVGDEIKSIFNNNRYTITELTDTHYVLVEVENKFRYTERIIEDKNWVLIQNKFNISTLKPFDKVLVRNTNNGCWHGQFYMAYDKNEDYPFECTYNCWVQCIPYEGNEHLLGATDDCDDYYKTWE